MRLLRLVACALSTCAPPKLCAAPWPGGGHVRVMTAANARDTLHAWIQQMPWEDHNMKHMARMSEQDTLGEFFVSFCPSECCEMIEPEETTFLFRGRIDANKIVIMQGTRCPLSDCNTSSASFGADLHEFVGDLQVDFAPLLADPRFRLAWSWSKKK